MLDHSTTQSVSNQHIPTGRKNQTKAQVAFHYNVSERLIEKWMASRKIPFRRLSRRCVRFDLDAIDQALARYDVQEIGREVKGA